MKRRAPAKLAALTLAIAGALSCRDASAVERQHHLGVGGGLAMLKIDDKTTMSVGGMGGLHYAYGLSDAFNLMVEGGYGIVAIGEAKGAGIPPTRPASLGHLGVGAGYVLDMVQWVPYVGALATGYTMSGGSLEKTRVDFGVGLAAGLDYQFTRSFAVGAAVRQHFILSAMSTYPTYTEGLLRAEIAWGW